jgi:serine/threonine protein phosphatase 1
MERSEIQEMLGVIGDVHGCVRTLDSLLDKLFSRYDIHRLIFLGDLVDRGPCSREVCSLIMELDSQFGVTCVKGNHEDVMLDYLRFSMKYHPAQFLKMGGKETVSSFSAGRLDKELALGKDVALASRKYFEPFMDFFDSFVIYDAMEYGDRKYHFSHAGIDDGNESFFDYTLFPEMRFYWTRNTEMRKTPYFGYALVHGHTPVVKVDVQANPNKPYLNYNKKKELCSVNLDTGCVYGYYLSAMVIDDGGGFEFQSSKFREKS